MSDEDENAGFLDGLTLSPDWAKKSADSHSQNFSKYASNDERDFRDQRERRSKPRFDRAPGAPRPAGGDNRATPPRDGQTPRPSAARRSFSDFPSPRSPRDAALAQQAGERPPRRDFQETRQPEFRQYDRTPPAPVPFEIRFLPDQKALSVIAHKVQTGHRAIPLRNLVKLFFDNPDSTEVRLEFNAENKDKRFYQCGKCGWFGMSEEDVRGHIIAAHFAEYFDSEEIQVDPPTGNFTSVARCGFTGKLIAPPNHHSYNKRILQMLRSECAGKSEEEYRSRIELVADPALIDQWRADCSKQTVYSLKSQTPHKAAPAAPATKKPEEGEATPAEEQPTEAPKASAPKLSLEEAEEFFARTLLPKLMRSDRQVTATHIATKTMTDRTILNAIAQSWEREQAIQTASLFFAVRGGLRSRKLALFRANDSHREEFVMHKTPMALDASHAVAELKMIIDYITLHPGCTKIELLSELIKNDTPQELADNILKQIAFVTERGYVIEYYNGVMAVPEEHPFFTGQQKKPGEAQGKKHAKAVKKDGPADAKEPRETVGAQAEGVASEPEPTAESDPLEEAVVGAPPEEPAAPPPASEAPVVAPEPPVVAEPSAKPVAETAEKTAE